MVAAYEAGRTNPDDASRLLLAWGGKADPSPDEEAASMLLGELVIRVLAFLSPKK